MRPTATRRDVAVLLVVAAAAALAASLGIDPRLAVEVAAAVSVLVLAGILLRVTPPRDPPVPMAAHEHALVTARRSVELALASSWGVEGRLRRTLRDVVAARVSDDARTLDDATLAALPTELADLLGGRPRRDRERGLTHAELDDLLTAVEELEP